MAPNIHGKKHLCSSCNSVDRLSPGFRGIVSFIAGGYGVRRKLKRIGITPGSKVEIISGDRHKILKTETGEYEIRYGLSRKIFLRLEGHLKIRCLSLCSEGDRVKIRQVCGSGFFLRRLREMGFISGSELEIVRYAPLKDPLELRISGYHVSLRVNEADNILVEDIE